MTELGEIPSEWHIEVLGECSNVTKLAGFEFTEYMEYIDDGEIIALRALNLKNGKLNLEDIKKIDKTVSESLTRSKLYINDVLFSYVGTVGEVALIGENDKFHLAPNVAKVTFNDSIVPKFALQYLMSSNMKSEINRYVTTTSQPALSMENIRKLKMIVPTKEEQEKISLILSTVDEQIDNVDALIEKNKELKKGLMQTLLTKGIGHTKFKKTEIGEIPEEWEIKTIEQISNIVGRIGFRGYNKTDIVEKGKGAITIGPSNIENNKFIEDNLTYLSWEKYYESPEIQVENGDILLVKTASVGKVIYIEGLNKKATINPQLVILKNIKCNAKYLYYTMINSKFQSDIKKASAGGVMLTLTHGNINSIKIALPRLDEQEKIALILSEIDEKIEGYENKKQKLEELKKGLMQQLLTGKIRAI